MKNIFHYIKFHESYLLIAFSFVLTGYFKNLILFTSIILIHEIGHLLFLKLFKYDVIDITIYPFGGILHYNALVNTVLLEEFFINIAGILFQLIYFVIFYYLFECNIIDSNTYDLFYKYQMGMLFFNILPIYPLDGMKLLRVILLGYFSFKFANYLVIWISCITLLFFVIYNNIDYSYFLIISVLLFNLYKYYKDLKLIFNKFLLERYLYKLEFKKYVYIKDIKGMRVNKRHFIRRDKKYITEVSFLKKMFDL